MPEFSHIVAISNLPYQFVFHVVDSVLAQCTCISWNNKSCSIPCQSKLLRTTRKKGGENRRFKLSQEHTPALQSLSDIAWSPTAVSDSFWKGCGKGEPSCSQISFSLDTDEICGDCCDWVFGIRWSPESFLSQAVSVGHPFSVFSGLPLEVKNACIFLAENEDVAVINNRCSKLGEWLRMSRSLQKQEEALKASMPKERRKILESKKLCLMRKIIQDEQYDDKDLAVDLEKGFQLVGEVPRSHVLPEKLLPATISTNDLSRNSRKANVALRYMTRSSGSEDLDNKLWEKTLTEVERGWLVGPLVWEDLPNNATVSRRFPLEQSGKVRPIDDLSQSQVNVTVTVFEQATVDGPDVICAFAVFMMRCLSSMGRSTCLQGRALDLASAYRQLAIADESSKHSYLSVYSPSSKKAELFRQVALPFGSRTAVNAFIRCARFLQWVSARCLRLPLSCYFDDFVSFATPNLANNTQAALCLMLDILGWNFDREGPKSDDFSQLVKALGVQFDLSQYADGVLSVCNTEKRIQETVDLIDGVLDSGSLDKKSALVLRGRLAFCDSFIFGRIGKIALQNITRHAYASPFRPELSASLIDSIKLLKDRVLTGRPRQLHCDLLQPMYLFTDASFDLQKGGGLGAVLVSHEGQVISWFGFWAETSDLTIFLTDGRETAIGELETLVVAMALFIWCQRLKSTPLMVYIDNEGSKFSLIKGYSSSQSITAICALAATYLDAYCILPWFSRVPSASNLADFPSRLKDHPLLKRDLSVSDGEVKDAFSGSMSFIEQARAPQ